MTLLKQAVDDYLAYCEHQKKLSVKTIKAYTIDLGQFIQYTASENIPTKADISAYFAHLHKICLPRTVKRKIASIRAFLNYLEFEEIILENPIKKIKTKFQEPQTLPKTIPLTTIESILRIAYQELKQAKTACALSTALRNTVIIELLFATGLRVSELCSLNVDYIDLSNGSIRIMGKGTKERILQIGNTEVLSIMRHYAETNAPHMHETGYFFVNRLSSRISEQSVRFLIRRLCAKAGIGLNITPHMFRHTFATLLLEEDVDIRYIQRMLGHSSILTTQIYTQVTVEKQRQILTTKHPRNRIVVNL
ncbi:MAG: tyrosine-type recombinase/integrase [Clostridiales bacterium]|jgi:integrase/recombinase XerD|nr:tyrosine-type recombinase/integrase [Clostridiales bacterium]